MISRREFLGGMAAVAWQTQANPPALIAPPDLATVRVDANALRTRIEALSAFGRPAGGGFGDGVSRTAYSDADVEGRAYVMGEMRAAGLQPRIDPAGNIFARREGLSPKLPSILFGSHIDSVPNGGNFDGDLGSLSALGVLEALSAAGARTRHPLELVVWAHEESYAFGRGLACSRIAAGDVTLADMDEVWNGLRRGEAIRKIGGDPDRILEARRDKGSHHCYLELHIEQGGTLERAHVPIGIVEGIVAIDRYEATITGVANHSGTTPIAVRDAATRMPGRQVATAGHIEVTPNSANVIPGLVRLSVELRDLNPVVLTSMMDDIRARSRDIASNTGTTIAFRELARAAPAAATPDVQHAIERAATRLTLEAARLPSGAGHDAQMMAMLGPMGMIFVPSIGGVSHSPKELTRWEDCSRGADVLLQTVLEMDRLS